MTTLFTALFTVFSLIIGTGIPHTSNRVYIDNPPPVETSVITQAVSHDETYYDKINSLTEAQWKELVTPEQYNILRQAGTETPFSSQLDYETRPGTYYSAGCGDALFRSEQKYDSGTGWPSFWKPITPDAVIEKTDNSILFETRTEILDKCGNHLGHVFKDGPQPTGLRYCMNGLALKFVPDENPEAPPIPAIGS